MKYYVGYIKFLLYIKCELLTSSSDDKSSHATPCFVALPEIVGKYFTKPAKFSGDSDLVSSSIVNQTIDNNHPFLPSLKILYPSFKPSFNGAFYMLKQCWHTVGCQGIIAFSS